MRYLCMYMHLISFFTFINYLYNNLPDFSILTFFFLKDLDRKINE